MSDSPDPRNPASDPDEVAKLVRAVPVRPVKVREVAPEDGGATTGDATPDAGDGLVTEGGAKPNPAVVVGRGAVRAFQTYWPLCLIVVVALGVRVWAVTVWIPECTTTQLANPARLAEDCYAVGGDAYYYDSMARNVAAGEGYSILSFATFANEDKADHPPGYVTFLALLNKLGLESVEQHRIAMSVFGSFGVGLLGLLGWRLGGARGRSSGIIAGVLGAFYPGFWMSEALYMSESFFVPFVTLTFLCTYRMWRSPSFPNAIWMGAAAGMAWLTRGEAAIILGFICIGIALCMRSVRFWRRIAYGTVASAVCIALMVPWVAYNLNRFPEPIFIAQTGTAFALNSCDEVWYGPAEGFYSFGCLDRYSRQVIAEEGELTDSGLNRVARQYIADNLSYYPAIMAVRVGRIYGVYLISDTRVRNIAAEGRPASGVEWQQNMYYLFLLGAPFGLVSLRRRKLPISPIIAAVAGVAISVATTFAIYRYRLAADVALLACASVAGAAGLGWLVGKAKEQAGILAADRAAGRLEQGDDDGRGRGHGRRRGDGDDGEEAEWAGDGDGDLDLDDDVPGVVGGTSPG